MKLSSQKREILDRRMVSYDPDVEISSPQDLLKLCCPLHGLYDCEVGRIRQKNTWHTMRAPMCPGCRSDKLPDKEYLGQANSKLSSYRKGGTYAMTDPPLPDWHPLDHWKKANLVKPGTK